MKKYLLVVFGDFTNTKSLTKIATGMTPIVDSPQLKLHQSVGSVVFHFESGVEKDDLQDFIVGLFYGTSDYFILTEMTDNVMVHMNDDLKSHLFDLNNESEFKTSQKEDEFSMSEDDFTNQAGAFVELLLEEFESEVKKPTLNELLDKITDKGLKSLTQFEKQILENYSKS